MKSQGIPVVPGRPGGKHFELPAEPLKTGQEFFTQYFTFQKPPRKFGHFELKNIAFIAPMGAGKTTQVKDIIRFVVRSFPGEVNYFMTDSVDMAVAHADLCPIQAICIDDATTFNDPRLSGGKVRATQTQGYFSMRHLTKAQAEELKKLQLRKIDSEIDEMEKGQDIELKRDEITQPFIEKLEQLHTEKGKLEEKKIGGVIFIIWVFQQLNAIDVRYREFFDVIFIKSYSRSPDMKRLLKNDKEILKSLAWITDQNMFNNWEVRNMAVGVTRTESLMILKTEYIEDEEFQIPYFSGESLREQFIDKLFTTLCNQPLDIISSPKDIIYGYFHATYKDNPDFRKNHIGKIEISQMIEEMKFIKREEITFYNDFHIEPHLVRLDKIVQPSLLISLKEILQQKRFQMQFTEMLKEENVALGKIARILDVNVGTLFRNFDRWLRKREKVQSALKKEDVSEIDMIFSDPDQWNMLFRLRKILGLSLEDLCQKTGISKFWLEFQSNLQLAMKMESG